MTWSRLDAGFAFNAKVVEAGNAAAGIYARSLSWSAQAEKDGFIPTSVALLIAGRDGQEAIDDLVKVRLWKAVEGGYRAPDFLDYNPSAKSLRERREQAANRMKESRSRSQDVRANTPRTEREHDANGDDCSRERAHEHFAIRTERTERTEEKTEGMQGEPLAPAQSAVAHAAPASPQEPEPKPKRRRKSPPPADQTPPEPGTDARAVFDALIADEGLRAIVDGPADFAKRITDPRRFPGVDVLSVVLDAAEYLARGTRSYTDGRAFLTNQLRAASERAGRRPAPAVAPPVVTQPANQLRLLAQSPPQTPEERAAEDARQIEVSQAMRRMLSNRHG